MKTYSFKAILQNSGWLENTAITVNDSGHILNLSSFDPLKAPSDVMGYALPGFQNAHSHAFQYAMAGLAERHENVAEQG